MGGCGIARGAVVSLVATTLPSACREHSESDSRDLAPPPARRPSCGAPHATLSQLNACASLLAYHASSAIRPSKPAPRKIIARWPINDKFGAIADRPAPFRVEDSPTTTAAPPSDAAGHLAAYADALADFMLTFQQLSDKAGRECKDRFWAASVAARQRPTAWRFSRRTGRSASSARRDHLRGTPAPLRRDAAAAAPVAALCEASPSSTKSSSSSAGADEDRPPPVEIVPAEEVARSSSFVSSSSRSQKALSPMSSPLYEGR